MCMGCQPSAVIVVVMVIIVDAVFVSAVEGRPRSFRLAATLSIKHADSVAPTKIMNMSRRELSKVENECRPAELVFVDPAS